MRRTGICIFVQRSSALPGMHGAMPIRLHTDQISRRHVQRTLPESGTLLVDHEFLVKLREFMLERDIVLRGI